METPPDLPPTPSQSKSEKEGSSTFGITIFIVGIVVAFDGFVTNPHGSGIRQAVLYQEMTNGILLMILGRLLYK